MVGGFGLPVSFVTGLLTRHLPLTSFSSVVFGFVTDFGVNIMPGTTAPQHIPAAMALSVGQLFSAAFSGSRDPRSGEYMDGARAALA